MICRSLYKLYTPDGLKHRKNVDQTKLPDSSILAMLIWQTEIGMNLNDDSVNSSLAYLILVLTVELECSCL